MRRYTEKETIFGKYLHDLQVKYIEINEKIIHKRIAIDVINDEFSILPLTFTYKNIKVSGMKNDFPFYLERNKIISLYGEFDRSDNTYYIDYKHEGEIYKLGIMYPVRIIMI